MTKEEIKNKLSTLSDDNYQEKLNLRGKLINLLKEEIATTTDKETQESLKEELSSQINLHKEQIKNNRAKFTKIPSNVGQKVKEIASAIKSFKDNPNLLKILKDSLKNTALSGAVVSAITLILAATSGTISLAVLSSLVPTISYIGLSNIIRNFYKDKLAKDNPSFELNKENLTALKNYLVDDEHLRDLINQKNTPLDNEQAILLNEELIKEYQTIKEKFPNQDLSHIISQPLIKTMEDLKNCYEQKKYDYVKDKNNMTPQDFAVLEKKALQLDIDLFKEENYLKEAGENAFKNIKISTVTMYLARLLLQGIFPSLSFKNINDLVTPFFLVVINNVVNMANYKDKIKLRPSKYHNSPIKFNDPSFLRTLKNENSIQYG